MRNRMRERGVRDHQVLFSVRHMPIKLTAMEIEESERNIANKIVRGSFAAVFFLQWLTAIG